MCDEPLTHSEIYHHAPWFISIFVQGRGNMAPYSPRHTSFQALVDVAVHHQWQHNLEKLYDSILEPLPKLHLISMRRSLSLETSMKFSVSFEHRSPHGCVRGCEIEIWIAPEAEV